MARQWPVNTSRIPVPGHVIKTPGIETLLGIEPQGGRDAQRRTCGRRMPPWWSASCQRRLASRVPCSVGIFAMRQLCAAITRHSDAYDSRVGVTSETDRARGALLGLACGDAVGTSVEFSPRGTFELVTDMVGGGPFNRMAGEWTDDTSMALCLAVSLLETRGFDGSDQLRRYLRWYDDGYLSSTGECFDVGNTVRRALVKFRDTGDPFSGPTEPRSAGNGSIMRLAPVVLCYCPDRERVRHFAAESSRTTHGTPEAVNGCQLLGGIMFALLSGEAKDDALRSVESESWTSQGLQDIAAGTYREKSIGDVRGSGYVVHCLEAALWCFWRSEGFEEAVLMAANLGDDADTTAAVCGQLAGSYWGESAIPGRWLERLVMAAEIRGWADELWAAAF